jgi:hypothetical protein
MKPFLVLTFTQNDICRLPRLRGCYGGQAGSWLPSDAPGLGGPCILSFRESNTPEEALFGADAVWQCFVALRNASKGVSGPRWPL